VKRLIVAVTFLIAFVASTSMALAAPLDGPCGTFENSDCGVSSNAQEGQFHGLIAITGMPSVFETTSHSGTKAGCGDCEWTLIAACPSNDPGNPGHATLCQGAINAPTCRRGVLERLYLSDADTQYRLVDTLCLKKTNRVIPIGNIAFGDVQRYLRDVTPPDLVITTQPRQATLSNDQNLWMGSGEVT
jgi:hypothetical protein